MLLLLLLLLFFRGGGVRGQFILGDGGLAGRGRGDAAEGGPHLGHVQRGPLLPLLALLLQFRRLTADGRRGPLALLRHHGRHRLRGLLALAGADDAEVVDGAVGVLDGLQQAVQVGADLVAHGLAHRHGHGQVRVVPSPQSLLGGLLVPVQQLAKLGRVHVAAVALLHLATDLLQVRLAVRRIVIFRRAAARHRLRRQHRALAGHSLDPLQTLHGVFLRGGNVFFSDGGQVVVVAAVGDAGAPAAGLGAGAGRVVAVVGGAGGGGSAGRGRRLLVDGRRAARFSGLLVAAQAGLDARHEGVGLVLYHRRRRRPGRSRRRRCGQRLVHRRPVQPAPGAPQCSRAAVSLQPGAAPGLPQRALCGRAGGGDLALTVNHGGRRALALPCHHVQQVPLLAPLLAPPAKAGVAVKVRFRLGGVLLQVGAHEELDERGVVLGGVALPGPLLRQRVRADAVRGGVDGRRV